MCLITYYSQLPVVKEIDGHFADKLIRAVRTPVCGISATKENILVEAWYSLEQYIGL